MKVLQSEISVKEKEFEMDEEGRVKVSESFWKGKVTGMDGFWSGCVCVYGCVSVWVCGCVSVWVCGCVGV